MYVYNSRLQVTDEEKKQEEEWTLKGPSLSTFSYYESES